ncbi:MAG: hypothetical protein HETSPECPRED_007264 [Heterodermia speciosa]|uniref:Aminoglycoside phosphotransferase domain-containing protein n=1 Tax=Heterodermia speciosa TaxID=116794 RepID=A0A8H3FX49_9LECA|nr:MAG: hypothetical protein HETSPECPRED_007264 [Heterodermia speciosa]
MAFKPDRPYRLRWSGGYAEGPVWPPEREPDIDIIRSLVKEHLQGLARGPLNDTSLKVSFFAEGAFNKLYQISAPELESSYLLRATLPVEPYFKTESEVATIAFLRANTSIPVPKIIAWQSNFDGPLGSEWILMEKLDGVTLFDVWRKVPWHRKLELVEGVAKYVKELQCHRFDKIGGLYYKSALEGVVGGKRELFTTTSSQDDGGKDEKPTVANERLCYQTRYKIAEAAEKKVTVAEARSEAIEEDGGLVTQQREPVMNTSAAGYMEVPGEVAQFDVLDLRVDEEQSRLMTNGLSEEFVVGRLFHDDFYKESRYYLPGDRGPYDSSLHWLSAMVQFQLQWIENVPIYDDNDYCEEETTHMKRLSHEYLQTLPSVFKGEKAESSYILYHQDLNAANIIVHPETFEIIGIVDWEAVNVVPLWRAVRHPRFLEDMEPFSDETSRPPTPIYEDEESCEVSQRDRWDYKVLRNHWDSIMMLLKKDDEVLPDPEEVKTKNDCLRNIRSLTEVPNWARIWLYRFKTGTNDIPPDDDIVKRMRERRFLKSRNKHIDSAELVRAKSEIVGDLAVTNDATGPAPVDADADKMASDEFISSTTAQTAEQATSTNVATEPQLVNGLDSDKNILSKQSTQEEAHSPASDTISS